MASEKPVFLPADRGSNRPACILFVIVCAVECALAIAFAVLIWLAVPVIYSSIMPQPFPKPVAQDERFNFPLFSIGVPVGSGWTYRPMRGGVSFELQETVGDQTTLDSERTTVASAWSEALSTNTNYSSKEFLDYACAYLDRLHEGDRYTEQEKACDWWKKSSFECVRLYGLYTDRGPENGPYSQPLMIDSYSLACRHPDFYNAVIFLNYVQQGSEASIQEDVSQQADVFFTGIGMNFPTGTQPASFTYETSQKIQTVQPGTNLAYQKPVRVSRQLSDFPAWMAVDGKVTNWWGAGARPPQWIEIDLGENYIVSEVRLLISQSPQGRTIHQILARGLATDDEYSLIHTFDGVTLDYQSLIFKPPESFRGIRYIRIETPYTPSWVGWREIEVIAGE